MYSSLEIGDNLEFCLEDEGQSGMLKLGDIKPEALIVFFKYLRLSHESDIILILRIYKA